MITSKTYYGQPGSTSIQASELAFTNVYVVKREGTNYERYFSGDASRKYTHTPSSGTISFLNPFAAPGEGVFVIFEEGSITNSCNSPIVSAIPMPSGQVGTPYQHNFFLVGTQPFSLSNIVKPAWATVSLFLNTSVRLKGTPTTEGVETVSFDVSNCGGAVSHTDSFAILPGTNNFFVTRAYFTTIVRSVTGIGYTITSGFIPSVGMTSTAGVHGAYTGTIGVELLNISFPLTLRLIVNSVEQEAKPVPSNGWYEFASGTYLSTDQIEILLN
jgi:hypothetical protein